jgi:glycosyltransferase involved in cell wall biosynthesis
VLWDQFVLPRRARACGASLLHCASGTMPKLDRMPIVVTVHDLAWHAAQTHAPAYARYYFGAFSLRRYRRAARIVVDSEFSRGELMTLLDGVEPERVDVVYPGVSPDFSRCTRAGDGRTILAVGTVERRKNLEVLIHALARLPDARLRALGPHTPYANECVALARRLGVLNRVDMAGYVSREELLAAYRTAAVAAVPSRYEGFGYAAAQALCAGLPCIVSNQSSLPEIVAGEARIVDAGDPTAWAAALAAAVAGEDDARAVQCRSGAIARFSWDASAGRIERVYASAAA